MNHDKIQRYEQHQFLVKQDEKLKTDPDDLKNADRNGIIDYLAKGWYSEEDARFALDILSRWGQKA